MTEYPFSECHAVNVTREAFLHPVNLGFLLTVCLVALLLSGTPWMPSIIFTIGLGLELLYLGTVPRQSWFRHHVIARRQEEERCMAEEKKEIDRLNVANQKRFFALRRFYNKIRTHFGQMPSSSRLLTDSLSLRLDELLSEYVKYLVLEERFNEYLTHTSSESLVIEIRALEKEINEVTSERLYEVKQRRLEILKKRFTKLKLARGKADLYLSYQQTIEDAVLYVYEKSLTMSCPEEIGHQLDRLMSELEDTTAIIKEIEKISTEVSDYD